MTSHKQAAHTICATNAQSVSVHTHHVHVCTDTRDVISPVTNSVHSLSLNITHVIALSVKENNIATTKQHWRAHVSCIQRPLDTLNQQLHSCIRIQIERGAYVHRYCACAALRANVAGQIGNRFSPCCLSQHFFC